jgi:predicted short-subunit dehydrogenase-like oxidoreductase (DUF2520 family)
MEQVILLGAGNVAWHLGQQLYRKAIAVSHVYSRDLEKAQQLAREIGSTAGNDLAALPALSKCLYILAIRDDAIPEVAESISFLNASDRLFVHTSGATSATILQKHFSHSGVFYPLQSFSRERELDFGQVPMCVDGSDQETRELLFELGKRIVRQVALIDDHQRRILHLAAVFVNNFSNYLFGVGKDLVEREKISFDLLRPLIRETAAKVMENDPAAMQTGPARRHDSQTIAGHLAYLEAFPHWQEIYLLLSKSIEDRYTQES